MVVVDKIAEERGRERRRGRRDKKDIPGVSPKVSQHPVDEGVGIARIGDDRSPVGHQRPHVGNRLFIGAVHEDDNTFGGKRKDGVKQVPELRPAHDRPQIRGG